MYIIKIVIGIFLILYGMSSFPWPKEDRHKKYLALGCIFIVAGGLIGILANNWIVLVTGAVIGFGVVMLHNRIARNPQTMAKDTTYIYEKLRKDYGELFRTKADIIYGAAIIYLAPYIKVGKLFSSDIKTELSDLVDTFESDFDCPGFFNDFAFFIMKVSEIADGLNEQIAEATVQSNLIVVVHATKHTRFLMEGGKLVLPKWDKKINNALDSAEFEELLKKKS